MSNHDAHGDHGMSHVSPLSQLLLVFFSLVGLTILTVVCANAGLGRWDFLVAMIIATVKATLVALYFMHLRHDKLFNTLTFLGGVLFLLLFLGLALLDVAMYQDYLLPAAQ